jgi:hypothetical protein
MSRVALHVVAPVAVVAALVGGVLFWSGVVFDDYYLSIAAGFAWFLVVAAVAGKLTKGRGSLRTVTRATVLTCSALALVGFYWTSIRETEVNEDIVVGVAASEIAASDETQELSADERAALAEIEAEERALAEEEGRPEAPEPAPVPPIEILRGDVEARGHDAKGRASVVEKPDGTRVLTLSKGFDIDPGPQVRVYLVPEGNDESDVSGHVDLGKLKGSKGDQQYEIPQDVDLDRLSRVNFWCVPFTQTLAIADLAPA